MFEKFLLLLNIIALSYGYAISPLLNQWYPIDFIKNIDITKPHSYNIGELPLVSWFTTNNTLSVKTTINICNHRGSKLGHGKVKDGCLVCPYHGLKHKTSFGKTIIYQDKLWWAYEPITHLPPSIPLYNDKNYESSFIKIDINAGLKDCMDNLMDLNHAGSVHNNILGFGSDVPASDLKTYEYSPTKIGISFAYKSNSNFKHIKNEIEITKNFNMIEYPFSSWSRVSMPNNEHLYVNIHMLPLAKNKTRWLVTLRHNYWRSYFEKLIMKIAAKCILLQDASQLSQQADQNELRSFIENKQEMASEDHFKLMKRMFSKYTYPNSETVSNLYLYNLGNIHKQAI